MLQCQNSETSVADPNGKKELAYGALSWGGTVPWTPVTTELASDTVLDLAMGADGSVFKLMKAISQPGNLGKVYQYVPSMRSNPWVIFGGDTVASAIGVDTSGCPWAANRVKVMKWNGSAWTATQTAPPDTVRDVVINEDGTLYALCRAGSQKEGKIYLWTGNIAGNNLTGNWILLSNSQAIAIAAGSYDQLIKVDSTGWIKTWDGDTWNSVDNMPAREIAMGKDDRIWATLKNSPPGGDTVAYKLGSSNFVKVAGLARHIACHGGVIWAIANDNKIYRGSTYRSFESSFDSINDFESLWVTSPALKVSQVMSNSNPKHGAFSHYGKIIDSSGDGNDTCWNGMPAHPCLNHRGYPVIRLNQVPLYVGGPLTSFGGRTLTSMWVKVKITLSGRSPHTDDWFSFATFSSYDNWVPYVVTVNLNTSNKVQLFHVPKYGQQTSGQCGAGCPTFPQDTWVRLDIYLDTHPTLGSAKVWQNGIKVDSSGLTSQSNFLSMAHFGMYAGARSQAGEVYNDKLRIQEVENYSEAELLVNKPF